MDGLEWEGPALPPAGAGSEDGLPCCLLRQHIGAGPQGAVPVSQGNGDVQQNRQRPVGGGKSDGHRPLSGGHRPHAPQPLGVVGVRRHSVPEGLGGNRPRQGGAIGKGDPLPQGEGPGQPVLADGVTAAQQGLGLKRGVHREEPLIEQGAQSQICPVGRPGGVERVLGVKGEGKGDRGGDGLLLLRRRGEVRAGDGRGLRLAAAGKGQGQRRAEKQQENTPTTHGEPHSHKSWIMAAMLPRRSPITR